jgi:hypothetical protein
MFNATADLAGSDRTPRAIGTAFATEESQILMDTDLPQTRSPLREGERRVQTISTPQGDEQPVMITLRGLLLAAVAAILSTSCSTSPPGAGFTNGENAPIAEEKTAVRSDLPMPTNPDPGDARLAGPAAESTQEPTPAKSPVVGASPSLPGTPPKIESSGEAGAQGGTRPPGNINVGTPRSPQ